MNIKAPKKTKSLKKHFCNHGKLKKAQLDLSNNEPPLYYTVALLIPEDTYPITEFGLNFISLMAIAMTYQYSLEPPKKTQSELNSYFMTQFHSLDQELTTITSSLELMGIPLPDSATVEHPTQDSTQITLTNAQNSNVIVITLNPNEGYVEIDGVTEKVLY
jgi:hypothetical protein